MQASPTRLAATKPPVTIRISNAAPGSSCSSRPPRLWRSLGHYDAAGRFRIDGVTGPDEYSAIADNNVYTNLMAQLNFRLAADAVASHPERARGLGIDVEEAGSWRAAADAVFIPYDDQLAVHPQSEGFTEHQRWDFEHTGADDYPLLLHAAYFDLYRKQITKQADLVLALHVRGDAFSHEEKARDFAYYEALTVRDSSLSACTQAVVAAELGHLDLAYDYFGEAALIDLGDLHRNTRDGLHTASLAGAWTVAVAGFGGMRDHHGALSIAPRLPQQIGRMSFTLCFRGRQLHVDCTSQRARYTLSGAALDITHHGKPVKLSPGKPVTRKISPAPGLEPPKQPPGREPRRRLGG
jgi:alpha,alpha-trehalose phosphorylase